MKIISAGFKPNKIKISNELFDSTISLLESLDAEDFDHNILQLYGYVLYAFYNKRSNIKLRNACIGNYFSKDSLHSDEHPDDSCHCCDCGNVPF